MKRVRIKFNGSAASKPMWHKFHDLYSANAFASWSSNYIPVAETVKRMLAYIESVKNCKEITLWAWNPETKKLETFDDRKALEYVARTKIPWGCKSFQRVDRAIPAWDYRRGSLIADRLAYSWRYWRHNKIHVPNSMVNF